MKDDISETIIERELGFNVWYVFLYNFLQKNI